MGKMTAKIGNILWRRRQTRREVLLLCVFPYWEWKQGVFHDIGVKYTIILKLLSTEGKKLGGVWLIWLVFAFVILE